MAKESPQINLSFPAGADLSAAGNQYKFVKFDASGNVVLCAAVTDTPIGVLQNNPTSGQAATVCMLGRTKIQADEALTGGSKIGTSADGQAQVVVLGTETTVHFCGQVQFGVSNAGELATAIINCIAPARAS